MSEHFLYDTWISVKGVSKVKLFPKGFPSRKHLLEAICKNTRVISWILCWICSKLPIKTSERRPCKLRTRIPSNIYLSKVNYRRTRKKYEISSKLTIKTTEGRHWRRSGVFIVNFTDFTPFSSASIDEIERAIASLDLTGGTIIKISQTYVQIWKSIIFWAISASKFILCKVLRLEPQNNL